MKPGVSSEALRVVLALLALAAGVIAYWPDLLPPELALKLQPITAIVFGGAVFKRPGDASGEQVSRLEGFIYAMLEALAKKGAEPPKIDSVPPPPLEQ